MKEKWKRILSIFLVFIMVFTTEIPSSISANEFISLEDEGQEKDDVNGSYAIVSKSIGKAVNITEIGWSYPAKVEADYLGDKKVAGDNVKFIITKINDNINHEGEEDKKITVCIELEINNEKRPLVKENGGGVPETAFIANDKTGNADYIETKYQFILEKIENEEDIYIIQAAADERYATIENNQLKFAEDTKKENAEKFLLIKDPEVVDSAFSIEHKGSGKYIKTYKNERDFLTVDGEANDQDTKFSKISFGEYNNNVVVSFISKSYGMGLKSGGVTCVEMNGNTTAGGYESIRVVPNGDGTISLKDSLNGKYITVKEVEGKNVLVCNEDIETLTDNEKFIIHTNILPDSAKNLEVSYKRETDTSVKLLWENPECLFTGIEIYQKEENGEYTKIANLSGEESYTVKGLTKDQSYTFKVRIMLGSGENALYADSKEITGIPKNDENILHFSEENTYAIISNSGKALDSKINNWVEDSIRADVSYDSEKKEIESANAQFIIKPLDEDTNLEEDEVKVTIICYYEGKTYPLRTEGFPFPDPSERFDEAESVYIIKKTKDNTGTIKAVEQNAYLMVDSQSSNWKKSDTMIGEEFIFVENPTIAEPKEPEDPNAINISIEHKGTGKYIKTYKENGSSITVDGEEDDKDTIFKKIVFGTNTNTEAGGENGFAVDTISFVSKQYNTGLQSVIWKNDGADASQVLATDTITGNGWETVRVVANNDGSISFRDSYYNQLITVENNQLVGRKIMEGTYPTDNEKFILHISDEDKEILTPNPVTEFQVNDSDITETTLELSWKNPTQCLFTGLELYQKKTSENDSEYKRIVQLSEEESYQVTELESNVSYDFKICVVLNRQQGAEAFISKEETVTAITAEKTEEEEDQEESIGNYAIVSESIGKAVNITNVGYLSPAKVEAYYLGDKKVAGDNVIFEIIKAKESENDNKTTVYIRLTIDNEVRPLVKENGGSVQETAFIAGEPMDTENLLTSERCKFILEKIEDNTYILQAAADERYATIENNQLKFAEDTKKENAEKFLLIQNPEVVDSAFSIEHKGSGKYIKTYKNEGDLLTVDGEANDQDTKFSKISFGEYNNNVVVSFISKSYEMGLKSGGVTCVEINGNTMAGGYESIRVIPNGDGTISLKDSLNGKYITVKEVEGKNVLVCNENIETLTDNEKFVIHTELPLESVEDLKIVEKGGTDTSIKLSWKNPKCLFTGTEIYQKDENGEYTKIANLAEEESYTITGLTKGKGYTFKIRTVLGSGKDALYADSKEISGIPKNDDRILHFSENSTYAIISKEGKAVDTKVNHWVEGSLKADSSYHSEKKEIESANAKFIIKPLDDDTSLEENEVKVTIICYYEGEEYPLRTENFPFADPSKRFDGAESVYIIQKSGNGIGTIKAENQEAYLAVDTENNNLIKDSIVGEEFSFIENPEIVIPEEPTDPEDPDNPDEPGKPDVSEGAVNISIEHKKTGNYIQTKEKGTAITVAGNKGDKDTIFKDVIFGTNNNTGTEEKYTTISFISKEYNTGLQSVIWNGAEADASQVLATETITGNGWETIRVMANDDGTISFKDSYYNQLITVEDNQLVGKKIALGKEPTDNEKFLLHIPEEDKEALTPKPVTEFEINDSKRTETTLDLSWKNPTCLFTSIELYQKKTSEKEYTKIGELKEAENYHVAGLEKGVSYDFKICVVLFRGGEEALISAPVIKTAATRNGIKPDTPTNVDIEETANGTFQLTWEAVENATSYKVMRAPSLYGNYIEVKEVKEIKTEVVPENSKYSNYYYILAVNGTEKSDPSESVSLETKIFGDHTIFLAETDDIKQINRVLRELYEKGNDFDADAQFKGEQWQVYFKPGDYRETDCMYLGFYTSFNGLGKTPYDVKLNNIAIWAYLPGGELGGENGNNATCNFWRSAENLSIINTGNEQGKAEGKPGDVCYRPDSFNWAVAQAAPLRRIYTNRHTAYDWNFGWASGGYVADCYMAGQNDAGDGAGTYPGQQFFTRNTKVTGNTYGTTLNNFFMGVEANNNLTNDTGEVLKNENGYSNWGIASPDGGQQVVTEITSTPKISEKPFLYLDDDGEYKVFVPAVQEDTRGISWGEGKENNGMGKGESLPLSDFYIATPEDTAEDINKQIEDGNNIYFTPGIYHAEVPINVNRENAILLGTGMTSIIPDNEEMAMYVEDLDGIRIEGLIFDAGLSSKYLLQVGKEGEHNDHSKNPIILQDLFFRVGGTTDVLTKADDALEINSDDVIGDHFWIWRADHGAGVEWYGNESKHGLIVNGDNVNCYALFNEHFQEYHTLWNGENGATYFYQNETCYDPISQEAWMSHGGTVKGYSSYKVSNDVTKHYAVGLGIYNVFIYTGPSYDSKGIGIQLDNAIEVPNAEEVLVENACIQTFANEDSSLVRINHIINGVGGSASSGYSKETGESGEGWSRKFLLYYHDGEAAYGKETNPATFGKDNDERGKFLGIQVDKLVEEPEDEVLYLERIKELIEELSKYVEENYTKNSWKNAQLEEVLKEARKTLEETEKDLPSSSAKISIKSIVKAVFRETGTGRNQAALSRLQSNVNKACTKLEAAKEKLVYIKHASNMQEICESTISAEDYNNDAAWRAYEKALKAVEEVLKKSEEANPETKVDVYNLQQEIDKAYTELGEARKKLTTADFEEDYDFSGSIADSSQLEETYHQYEDFYQESDYTSESWEVFQQALSNAKIQLSSGAVASQDSLDKAKEELEKAVQALMKKEPAEDSIDLSKLKEAYQKYVDYKESDYTSESWNVFQQALSNAKVQIDKGEQAVQDDINKALKALNEAAEKLVRNSNSDNNNNSSSGNGNDNNNSNTGNNNNNSGNGNNSSNSGSNIDKWLETLIINSMLNNGNSGTDIGKLLEVVKEISDVDTDLAQTQGRADALLAIIDSLVKNMDDTEEVTGITLNETSITLKKEETFTLQASITPVNAANKTIIWNSSNTLVATVSNDGIITAVGKGNVRITATTADGLKIASCDVTVEVPASKLTLSEKEVYIVKGKKVSIKGVITPEDSTDNIKWSTSNSSVASVKKGKITAKKAGTATITAKTSNGKKAKCKVYVIKKAKKSAFINQNKNKISMKKGGWVLLSEVLKTDVEKGKSSNKKIISSKANGFIKAKKKGKAVITITTLGGKKIKYNVTIK